MKLDFSIVDETFYVDSHLKNATKFKKVKYFLQRSKKTNLVGPNSPSKKIKKNVKKLINITLFKSEGEGIVIYV